MPVNLNALIRYKQIDLCLRNKFLKATIDVMQRKCSEQLAEHRGLYKKISERTIRDDIRVMRSDALGFNAPIVVRDGVYSYEDPDYSIFKTGIPEMELLKEITRLLIKEKDHIKNNKLNGLLETLSGITGIKIAGKNPVRSEPDLVRNEEIIEKSNHNKDLISDDELKKKKNAEELKIKVNKPKAKINEDISYLISETSDYYEIELGLSQLGDSGKIITKEKHLYFWEHIFDVL